MVIATLPHISISLAPPEEPMFEPHSPFSWAASPVDDEDSYRPSLLSPPVAASPRPRQLSPLRPSDSPVVGKGLERERFEALLKASRERNSAVGAKRTPDLRKEVALKHHKNKQVERRALFLSKITAPPSPTAATLPKTPPESPAIFHYTLPSPGLVSPLALFESLHETGPTIGCKPWVEQVDFRFPTNHVAKTPGGRSPAPLSVRTSNLPSLADISARLGRTSPESAETPTRLSAFLSTVRQSGERARPPVAVGRLQIPARMVKPRPQNLNYLPPASPKSPMLPKLQVTTLVVPRSSTLSPTELSETNLQILDSRQRRAKDMLSTIRRRVVVGTSDDGGANGHEELRFEKFIRRRSAPADLGNSKPRSGFEHPVLAMAGGF